MRDEFADQGQNLGLWDTVGRIGEGGWCAGWRFGRRGKGAIEGGRRFVGGGEKLAVGWGAGMACCACAVYNALGRGEQRKEMVRKAFVCYISKLRQHDDDVLSRVTPCI